MVVWDSIEEQAELTLLAKINTLTLEVVNYNIMHGFNIIYMKILKRQNRRFHLAKKLNTKVLVIYNWVVEVCMLFRLLFTDDKPVQGKFSITEEPLTVPVNDFSPPKLFQTKPNIHFICLF